MAEEVLSAAERQAVIDRRLDEVDRALLGILPRSQRLAIVADVEARVQGGAATLTREALPETNSPAFAPSGFRRRCGRSRLAVSSGVLGIIAVASLFISPILLIGLSAFGELIGEEFAILLFYATAFVIGVGGILAVSLGGVSLIRQLSSGQAKTGTGWAITGLCTGALPMFLGLIGLLSVGASVSSTPTVSVSMTTPPGMPAYGQPMPSMPMPAGPPMMQPMPVSGPMPPPMPMYGSPMPSAPATCPIPPTYPPPDAFATPPQLPAAAPSVPMPQPTLSPPTETKPVLADAPTPKVESKPEVKSEPVPFQPPKLEPTKPEAAKAEPTDPPELED